MAKENIRDRVWEQLFAKYDILAAIERDGIFEITANQIKEFYEPRLVTKYDWSSSLPQIFQAHKLAILPDSRGTYKIGPFKAYQPLVHRELRPILKQLPNFVHSFDHFPITSESMALNVAQASGMIDDVLDRQPGDPAAVDTLTGRVKSGHLTYQIATTKGQQFDFAVANSQVEIDAGYENQDKLAVIEAKRKLPQDFMIRQLYYPYRLYQSLQTGKTVVPIYFTYVDQIYAFHIYEFTDPMNYSSIHEVRQVNFVLNTTWGTPVAVALEIAAQSPNLPEQGIYPQANSFSRVLGSLASLEAPLTGPELAAELGLNARQGDYYGNALVYLGLATKVAHQFTLTELGQHVRTLPNGDQRNQLLLKQLLAHRTFKLIFEATMANDQRLDLDEIRRVMQANIPDLNATTINRRVSTVRAWMEWVLSILQ
ncbi:type II restriction enzyme [Levilactobacillus lindianensis]|uniref:type II restriction enzyme n=1 Tax=Levilactobacillus lindianensis TaxID=2486018 RepID=UPI000F73D786|nr:hypothetical protein [Levilactobacillus lindianensis]